MSTGPPRDLTPAVEEDVYLIASEALTNAFRHAKAREIQLDVNFCPNDFQLTISDDGVGIARGVLERGHEGHFGLLGMRERAMHHGGILNVKCPEGRGTILVVSIPCVELQPSSNSRNG